MRHDKNHDCEVQPCATETVAQILERERDALIHDWLALVEKQEDLMAIPLSYQDRTAHLPQLLTDVIARLCLDAWTTASISLAASHHGNLRRQQGYSAAMLVEESRILEVCLFTTLHKNATRVERGAHDYLLKSNFDNFRLRRAVRAMIEHRAADEQVCLYQQCTELALLCTGDAVVASDSAERVTHLNTAAELITGWSEKEAQGQPLSEIFGIVDHDTRKAQASDPSIVSEANRKSPRTSSGSLMRRDGVELNIKNCTAHIRDRDGNIAGMVAVFHDLGATRVKTLELSHQAQHDFMTDLPNRSLLNDRITQAISFARRDRKQLAVMFVDLDLFKKDQRLAWTRRRGQIAARGGRPHRGVRAPFGYRGAPRRR
jgi:PAS domain S-box-containing protein